MVHLILVQFCAYISTNFSLGALLSTFSHEHHARKSPSQAFSTKIHQTLRPRVFRPESTKSCDSRWFLNELPSVALIFMCAHTFPRRLLFFRWIWIGRPVPRIHMRALHMFAHQHKDTARCAFNNCPQNFYNWEYWTHWVNRPSEKLPEQDHPQTEGLCGLSSGISHEALTPRWDPKYTHTCEDCFWRKSVLESLAGELKQESWRSRPTQGQPASALALVLSRVQVDVDEGFRVLMNRASDS